MMLNLDAFNTADTQESFSVVTVAKGKLVKPNISLVEASESWKSPLFSYNLECQLLIGKSTGKNDFFGTITTTVTTRLSAALCLRDWVNSALLRLGKEETVRKKA